MHSERGLTASDNMRLANHIQRAFLKVSGAAGAAAPTRTGCGTRLAVHSHSCDAVQEAEQTDMQLAWSMLEVAKLLFSRDRAANALDLAGRRRRTCSCP